VGTLAVDASSPASIYNGSGTSATTASFTPPADSLLLAVLRYNSGNGDSPGTPTCSGGSLTWTLREHAKHPDTPNGADGGVAVFTAVGAGASMTVTSGSSGTLATGAALKVMVVTDSSGGTPGATGFVKGGSTAGLASVGLTINTTALGSRVMEAVEDWDATGLPTAGANTTFTGGDSANASPTMAYCLALRTGNDGTVGGSNALVINLAGASTNVRWIGWEVTPAVGPPAAEAGQGALGPYWTWPGTGPSPAMRFRPTYGTPEQFVSPDVYLSPETILGSVSIPAVGVTANVIDNYDDNSISGDWSNWGGGNVTEAGQQLNLLTNAAAAGAYFGIDRVPVVDLDGRAIGHRLVSAGNQALASFNAYPIGFQFSASNQAYWVINGGTVRAFQNVGGTHTQPGGSFTYVPGTHNYFAVQVLSGNLRWLWSTDGIAWTVHLSVANPFGGDTDGIGFAMVGTDSAEGSATTMVVDDLTFFTIATGTSATATPTTITGSTSMSGTGSSVAEPAVITGSVTISGTGRAVAAPATITGSTTITGTVTTTALATPATISRAVVITGTGVARAAPATLAGAVTISGTGVVRAAPPVITGAVTISGTPAAGWTVAAVTIAGAATISGTASTGWTVPVATISPAAVVISGTATTASGSTATPATIVGSITITGAGAAGSTFAAVAIAGSVVLSGTGRAVAAPGTITGTVAIGPHSASAGSRVLPGTVAPPAVVITGAGRVAAAPGTLVGAVTISGTGRAVALPAVISGSVTISGTFVTGGAAAVSTITGAVVITGSVSTGIFIPVTVIFGAATIPAVTVITITQATPPTILGTTVITGSASTGSRATPATISRTVVITGTAQAGALVNAFTISRTVVIPAPSLASPALAQPATITGTVTMGPHLLRTSATVLAATILGLIDMPPVRFETGIEPGNPIIIGEALPDRQTGASPLDRITGDPLPSQLTADPLTAGVL
jgi:hypothetical protein